MDWWIAIPAMFLIFIVAAGGGLQAGIDANTAIPVGWIFVLISYALLKSYPSDRKSKTSQQSQECEEGKA